MAWRIDAAVVRGEIDNRTPGRVTGRIWLDGKEDPVLLDLKGNCHRDLAGCRLAFTNPEPHSDHRVQDLNDLQQGAVGDMTAARKIRVPTITDEEFREFYLQKKPVPTQVSNCLYLEWFSDANGRVVIETVRFQCEISEHQWDQTPEQEREQLKANEVAMMSFLDQVATVSDDEDGIEGDVADDGQFEGEKPMDEFEAEQFLQESDRRTDRYMELLDKYHDHPDEERIIAQAMGWTQLSRDLEEAEVSREIEEEFGPDSEMVDPELDEADILDEDGDIFSDSGSESGRERDGEENDDWLPETRDHPLCVKARDLSVRLMKDSKANQYGYEDGPANPVHRMIFGIMCCSGKLAGALNGLAEHEVPFEPGMTVAWLKRALNYIHDGMAGAQEALEQKVAPQAWIEGARRDMFEVRGEVLALMEKYRRMLS